MSLNQFIMVPRGIRRARPPIKSLFLVLAVWSGRYCLFSQIRCASSFTVNLPRSNVATRIRSSTLLRVTEEPMLVPDHDTSSSSLEAARDRLQPYFNFPLDDWQVQAGSEIWNGNNVIVCAPTGSGKTVVGEMALHIAVEGGSNAIYTTPLKALSNQKFAELRPIFGKDNVGLSTGDMSINRGARVTVMTTEVYRNMAWRSSSSSSGVVVAHAASSQESKLLNRNELANNAVVVLDEFHYMGQPGRGGVWEECAITSPPHTQIVGLSATLPNADRLASWMTSVTGRKTVLVQFPGERPVPLRYLFASKDGLFPMFRDPDAGPGAPKGLLGLRGDGVPEDPTPKKSKKKRGFQGSESKDETDPKDKTKFPKGLHVNSALRMAAEKRIQRVNRSIERAKLKASRRADDDELDWRRPRGREGRGGITSPREERRERERLLKNEMRRSVPSLPIVLKRLERRSLLPAIFFIFSRAGCDNAAGTVCEFMRGQAKQASTAGGDYEERTDGKRKRKTRQRGKRHSEGNTIEDSNGRSFRSNSNYVSDEMLSSVLDWSAGETFPDEMGVDSRLSSENWEAYADMGLLNVDEVKEVASRVATFNKENEEIAFDDANMERFLFGVGSHHAGMLPAHKAFTEALFRAQLMKVVFATETLAAGINMPARTTVICSLAKRGDGSTMNLLETSNLLQMAGRAGRRGMDLEGCCLITATPFEGPDEAVKILTSPVKPIVSQFSPSFSLAVNLIARGEGKLDIARQLVQKSFAMWEKRQAEDSLESAVKEHGDGARETLQRASHGSFLEALTEALQSAGSRKRVKEWLEILEDRNALKKTSKAYVGAFRLLGIERSTLTYLERELETMKDLASGADQELLGDLLVEDQAGMVVEIETQRKRVLKTEKELASHPFTQIAAVANQVMEGSSPEGQLLSIALQKARAHDESPREGALFAKELSDFAKSAVVMKRKTRKLEKANPELDSSSLLQQMSSAEAFRDDTWQDMLAITKVLVAYGCLSTDYEVDADDIMMPDFCETHTFHVTPAGVNIGMLGFDNSLWCLVAMGGAWDTAGASSDLDDFQAAMEAFDNDNAETETDDEAVETILKPQQEAEMLISLLQSLSPSEMAGYVSCLVSEGTRGGGSSPNVVESFQRLSPTQQRVIESAFLAMERLMEVEKIMSVDESSRRCELDFSSCVVVTAWAAGCTWNQALEMSGAAPGDLARTLSRALDALRQFGNLPYMPVRANLGEHVAKDVSDGIHPEVRRLCREAARSMDRYPVKDPLPFDTDEGEVVDVLEEDTEDSSFEDVKDDIDQDQVDETDEVAASN